jgi:hypothetical protein
MCVLTRPNGGPRHHTDFFNCIFWDYAPLLPVVDWLYIGGWVMVSVCHGTSSPHSSQRTHGQPLRGVNQV